MTLTDAITHDFGCEAEAALAERDDPKDWREHVVEASRSLKNVNMAQGYHMTFVNLWSARKQLDLAIEALR